MTTVSTRLAKLEQQNTVSFPQTPDTPSSTVVVPAPGSSSQGVLGLPAISDLEHYSIDSCPDLSNRNILWTRVKSGGLSLPLPIDSCCSVSLVSGSHTDHLLASQPNLQFTPLSKKIPVSVANPNATLFATGTMQVPITFENGTNCTFLMLSVPGLAWPLMLGENHQVNYLKLVLHGAIFLATCLALAFGDKLQVDCSVYHALFATNLTTFWSCNDCTEYAGVTKCNFYCELPRNVETRKPMQVTEVMSHVAISGCNLQWFQNNPCKRYKK